MLSRRSFLVSLAAAPFVVSGAASSLAAAPADLVRMYKTPWCGCCEAWGEHMREAGFPIDVTVLQDLTPLKESHGISESLASCHTALVGGYVLEGHVPAADVRRLLAERPAATGLAVPGMPLGSPGMETDGPADSYEVILFAPGRQEVFSRY